MEGRKWEELNIDCLIKVFEKVGLDGMMFGVPYVCKSWYKASLDPQFWKDLNFTLCCWRVPFHFHTKMVKFAVDRSCGTATRVVFHPQCTSEALIYVLDMCPLLKSLIFPSHPSKDTKKLIPYVLNKLNCLEEFDAGYIGRSFGNIVAGIGLPCKKLVTFCAQGFINQRAACAIIVDLPGIKYLRLSNSILQRQNLILILKGCKELELLDVSGCIGFKEDDDEILKMASYIKVFLPQGSRLDYAYNYEEYDELDMLNGFDSDSDNIDDLDRYNSDSESDLNYPFGLLNG